MAKISIASVKALFQTGDRPTQENYEDLIDTASAQATDLGTAGNNESTINGIENTTIFDNFLATEWRSVKYMVSIKKTSGGDNKFYSSEISILVDGTDISVSEYNIMDNDGNIGTISVSKAGSTVSLSVVPVGGITPITLRYMRTGLKA
jgi:archaellum component FlaF (FlaF/FlaG flagellin family)